MSSGVENYVDTVREGRSAPQSYALLLGLRADDAGTLLKKVERGFRFTTINRLLKGFEDLSSKELAELLHTPPRTFARRKKEGRLNPRESDRLLTIARLFARALDLFEGESDAALRWLRSSQPSLAEETPLDSLRTELGTVEVERLIDRLEHGVFV